MDASSSLSARRRVVGGLRVRLRVGIVDEHTDTHSLSGFLIYFFFSSRRRHTRCSRDWSSDVCSSDLFDPPQSSACSHWLAGMPLPSARQARETLRSWSARPSDFLVLRAERFRQMRSEEHTSELQSRLHLVCRLLLEKKKKHNDRRQCEPVSVIPMFPLRQQRPWLCSFCQRTACPAAGQWLLRS